MHDELHDTFLRLFTSHEPKLRAFVRSCLPRRQDADEVMQEVSLVAWRKFGDLDDRSRFGPWATLLDQLDEVFAAVGPNLAAVVMEPTRGIDPKPGFLEGVRERCTKNGTLLVFDEITIGWRLCLGGAHREFGVEPDIAAFAKAISNGFARLVS